MLYRLTGTEGSPSGLTEPHGLWDSGSGKRCTRPVREAFHSPRHQAGMHPSKGSFLLDTKYCFSVSIETTVFLYLFFSVSLLLCISVYTDSSAEADGSRKMNSVARPCLSDSSFNRVRNPPCSAYVLHRETCMGLVASQAERRLARLHTEADRGALAAFYTPTQLKKVRPNCNYQLTF